MDQIKLFCAEYLQLESTLKYPDEAVLREDSAQELIYHLAFDPETVPYRPNNRSQARVLKRLVQLIEEGIEDWDEHGVNDHLMDALASAMAEPLASETEAAQQRHYVTYTLSSLHSDKPLSDPATVTLLESRNLIAAGGTTGLRTWEAALHLGQYLCAYPALVRGKAVLELGAGTGYLSIICARHLGASEVVASDGSDQVLMNLPDNLFLNDLQNDGRVRLMQLPWGHALVGTEEQAWNGGQPVHVALGADVTFDRRVIPSLVGTLVDLFELYPGLTAIISATLRNVETVEFFRAQCNTSSLQVEQVEDFPLVTRREQRGPFYATDPPIAIFRLSRQKA